MSKISEAWITTSKDTYYYDQDNMGKFYEFLKTNPKDIKSIQITETMIKEEFEKYHK